LIQISEGKFNFENKIIKLKKNKIIKKNRLLKYIAMTQKQGMTQKITYN